MMSMETDTVSTGQFNIISLSGFSRDSWSLSFLIFVAL